MLSLRFLILFSFLSGPILAILNDRGTSSNSCLFLLSYDSSFPFRLLFAEFGSLGQIRPFLRLLFDANSVASNSPILTCAPYVTVVQFAVESALLFLYT